MDFRIRLTRCTSWLYSLPAVGLKRMFNHLGLQFPHWWSEGAGIPPGSSGGEHETVRARRLHRAPDWYPVNRGFGFAIGLALSPSPWSRLPPTSSHRLPPSSVQHLPSGIVSLSVPPQQPGCRVTCIKGVTMTGHSASLSFPGLDASDRFEPLEAVAGHPEPAATQCHSCVLPSLRGQPETI